MIDIIILATWILLLALGCLYVLARTKKKRLWFVDAYFVVVFAVAVLFFQLEYLDLHRANCTLKRWNAENVQEIRTFDKQKVELANSNYELSSEVSFLKSRNRDLERQLGERLGERVVYLGNYNQDSQRAEGKELQQLGDQIQRLKQSLRRLQSNLEDEIIGR